MRGCGHQRVAPCKAAEIALPIATYAPSILAADDLPADCLAKGHRHHAGHYAHLHTLTVIPHAHRVDALDASAMKMNLPGRLNMTIDEPTKMHLHERVRRKMVNDEDGVPHP